MAGRKNKFTLLEEIGNRRILKLSDEYTANGYLCYCTLGNNKGVDVMVMKDFAVKEVVESTNYARRDEWVDETKFERYVNSLNFWKPLKRVLVVSYESNLSVKQRLKLKEEGIELRVEGKQD
jgi:hypothetical protein